MKIEINKRQVANMSIESHSLKNVTASLNSIGARCDRFWGKFSIMEGFKNKEIDTIEKELKEEGVFGDYQNYHPKIVAYYAKYFPASESSFHYYNTYLELVVAYNFYKETGAAVCGLWDIFTKDDARYVLLINKTMEELKND
tara:strand:- start:705 stop:1130 length:426 start_codon:yes stop_codon:yes gene_type:complete